MRRVAVGSAVLLALTLPASAPAQTAVAEGTVHHLSIGNASLTEYVVPFGVTWRIAGVRMDANTAYAMATYRRGGVTSQLAGVTDVTVRMLVPLLQDRGRIIVAGNVPTGTSALTAREIPVAGVITTDLLTMPVRSFGSGAGVTTGFALAQPVGSWVLGGIMVYRVGGAYEPIVAPAGTEAAEFRPGSEFRFRLGVERPNPSGVTVRASASWSRFGEDETDGEAVFDRGDRVLGEVVAEFPLFRGAGSVYGWNLYRSQSRLLVENSPQSTPASNLLGTGMAVSYPLTRALTIRPKAEVMVQSGKPGFGGGSGWITRVGSAASYRLGPVRIDPAVLIQLGNLEGESVFGVVLRGGVLWQN